MLDLVTLAKKFVALSEEVEATRAEIKRASSMELEGHKRPLSLRRPAKRRASNIRD